MIDAIVVTGLPASGRSTLLAQLLADLPAARCAVCIHRHARAFGLETSLLPVDSPSCVHYSEVFDFGSGCLCCSPDGDLSRLLNDLCNRQDELKLTHLLIETTGVADPKPFIKLFDNERYAQQFTLRSVICVVDLLRVQGLLEAEDSGDQPAGSRGRVQLRCSDILILNHADEASEHGESTDRVKKMLLAVATEDECSPPTVLAPCSFCCLGPLLLSSIALGNKTKRRMAPSTCEALPKPSMFQLRFGPGVHDAACSTCCLVRPRGGVASLEAVLAMLQLLLDSGEAYRIQGYLSFQPSWASSSSAFPPPMERMWAMPMVVVEGYYRGHLKISPVLRAQATGVALAEAEASNQPWQETAFDSAAADRGGCKIFLCGPSLDEAQLKAQLKQCLAPSFELVCNLEEAAPEAAQALDRMEQQVLAVLQAGWKDSVETTGLDPRASAERFAQQFAKRLTGAMEAADPGPPVVCPGRLRRQRGRAVAEAVEVHWENGVVSVSAPRAAPFSGSQDASGYRFVAGPSYQTLLLGSEVYCRQRRTESLRSPGG